MSLGSEEAEMAEAVREAVKEVGVREAVMAAELVELSWSLKHC